MKTRRRFKPERMDDPSIPQAEIEASFRFIRLVNRRLGGVALIHRELSDLRPRWPRDRPLRILDLGTGAADLPLAAIAWARARGLGIECVAIDNHRGALETAHRIVGDEAAIRLLELDAREAVDRFGADAFDLVHAGMMLHHLPDIEVATTLAIMGRLARLRLVWNDLHRTAFNAAAIRVLTIGRHPTVRFDAAASVAKGFTLREARDLADRVGLEGVRVRRAFAGRFVLTASGLGEVSRDRSGRAVCYSSR